MSGLIVEARNLHKTYYGKVPVSVLFDIDLEVREGEFVAIIGQSGSGKSTLLNILGCLDRATSGTLCIDSLDVEALDDDGLSEMRSNRIGFVFQYHYLLDELTCLENALLPILIRRGNIPLEEQARVMELLERVGLGKQLEQTPDTLSGGESQRCALVRALANRPRLILADEPTGNLDNRSGQEVFHLLREMNRETGVAVIMVTHDDRLARAADRVLLIEDGQIRELTREQHRRRSESQLLSV